MNLITKRVHMNRCNGREVKQLTLDRDFNVPDARPDALQIMKEQGEVQIEEVHMMEGKASVKGLLHFQILYASDGDIPVSEMTGTIPFEETISLPQAKAEDEISVQAEIGDLKSELINSRKLGMKAIVVLNVTAGSVCDGEGAIDIEGGEDIYTKKRTAEVSYLVFSKKDTLRVRDEWKIPGTKDAMQRILYSDVCIGELNTRMEEEKLLVEGQANVFVIYLGEGENPSINYFENTLPIEGHIDCHGCNADMVEQVTASIHSRDLGVKEDEDGEFRVLEVEVVFAFDMKVYGQEKIDLLTDFYSLKEKCKPVYEPSYFENLKIHNKSKCRFTGMVTAGEFAPLQIWNVSGSLFIDHKEQKEEILEQQTPNTSTDSPTVPFSDTSAIPAPFIFIKSDLRLVIDLQTCIKAQQSEAYAQKVKLTNLKQMAQTVAYIQEHGYDSLDDFHAALDQASDQTSASRKSLKDTEQQLKDVNEQIEKVKDL